MLIATFFDQQISNLLASKYMHDGEYFSSNIFGRILYEFPIEEVKVNMPEWIAILKHDHYLKKVYISKIKESVVEINKLKDIDNITLGFRECEYIEKSYISNVDTSKGEVTIQLDAPEGLYKKILNDIIGFNISSKAKMLSMFQELNEAKRERILFELQSKKKRENAFSKITDKSDELHAVFDYQRRILRRTGQGGCITVKSDYDFYNYCKRIYDGRYSPLEKHKITLTVTDVNPCCSLLDYACAVVWYGRNQAAALYSSDCYSPEISVEK